MAKLPDQDTEVKTCLTDQKQWNFCIYRLTTSEARRQVRAQCTAVLLGQLRGVRDSCRCMVCGT